LTPKIALISVGTQNRFGFPDEVVLDRLRRHHVEIYRTDIMGTVILTYDENKRKWTVHLPFEDDF
jgi:competence protein ComEC